MEFYFNHADHLAKDEIAAMYRNAKNAGVAESVFYDGEIENWGDFVGYMCHGNWLVQVKNEHNEEVGFFWLNGFMGRTAMIHFCVYDLRGEDALELGRQTVEWVTTKTNAARVLYGITPKVYRHVFPFITGLGFEIVGELPEACFIARKNKYYPGVLSVYAPQEV